MITKDRRKDIVIVSAIVTLLILGIWLVQADGDGNENLKKANIVITNSEGEEYELNVEIADDKEERKEGLMDRESLCEDCGMLFVYEEDVHKGFWMKDTYISLSIAFISEDGTINEIQYMQPRTLETHKPNKPYRYALEVNQGYFSERNIKAGDTVDIPEKIQ